MAGLGENAGSYTSLQPDPGQLVPFLGLGFLSVEWAHHGTLAGPAGRALRTAGFQELAAEVAAVFTMISVVPGAPGCLLHRERSPLSSPKAHGSNVGILKQSTHNRLLRHEAWRRDSGNRQGFPAPCVPQFPHLVEWGAQETHLRHAHGCSVPGA